VQTSAPATIAVVAPENAIVQAVRKVLEEVQATMDAAKIAPRPT
jgi:hypothetical protein